MINLMPYDLKKQASAARTNRVLFRFVIILGFSACFLVLACSVTYLFLFNDKLNAENEQLKIVNSSNPTQKLANEFRTNLTISKSIFDRQVSYSNLLTEIGKILPSGTALDSLTISDSSFGTSTKLKVLSKSSDNETKLKQNIEGSRLFSNYKFESTASAKSGNAYPYVINISVTINKGSAT